jgi:hypothetical protein
MDQLGPEVLLAFALVGLALIIVMWSVARKLRRTGSSSVQSGQSAATSAPLAQFNSAPTAATTRAPEATPINFNTPAATPATPTPAAQPAREPSYTEIAAAAGGVRPSAPPCTQKHIDYSDAATDVGAGASYTAIAIAEAARAARNLPPLSTTPNDTAPAAQHSNGNSQSYTAIAVATVGEFMPERTTTASPPRIDYANTAAEAAAASASYAAIAVASAANNA